MFRGEKSAAQIYRYHLVPIVFGHFRNLTKISGYSCVVECAVKAAKPAGRKGHQIGIEFRVRYVACLPRGIAAEAADFIGYFVSVASNAWHP